MTVLIAVFGGPPNPTETCNRTQQLAAPCVENGISAKLLWPLSPLPQDCWEARPDTPTFLRPVSLCPKLVCVPRPSLGRNRGRGAGFPISPATPVTLTALCAGSDCPSVWCHGRTVLCPLVLLMPLRKWRICWNLSYVELYCRKWI